MKLIQRMGGLLLTTAVVVALWGDIVIRPSRTNSGKKKGGLIVANPNNGEKPGPREQKIELLKGDTLRGIFLGYDPEKGVLWRHPAAQNEIQFMNSAVKSVIIGKSGTQQVADHEETCSVQLRNGDKIIGKLVELDEKKLYLDTWYGGTLAIPRAQVRAFSPSIGVSTAIYEGPLGIEGWTGRNLRNMNQQEGFFNKRQGLRQIPQKANISGWGYSKNTLVATGAGALISRSIKYPGRVRIDFDLQWQAYFQLEIGIMADNAQQYAGNGYVVGVTRNNAYLYRLDTANGRNNIGQHQYQSLLRKTRASFSILIDKTQKTFTLMVDGVLARQWKEGGKFVGTGNILKFASQGSGQLKLSRIRVLEWDGHMPATAPDKGGKISADQAYMAKSGNVKGRLIGVKDGQMTFHMDSIDQELDVPLNSIIRVQLAGPAIDPPANDAGLTRLHFVRGGSLTVALSSWDASQVSCECEALGGTVKFMPSAFSRVEFNLDKHVSSIGDPITSGGFLHPAQRVIPQNENIAPRIIRR